MGSVFSSLRRRKILSSLEGLSEQSRQLVEEMDDFTLSLVVSFPPKVLESNAIGEGGEDGDLETAKIHLGWEKTGKGWDDWKENPSPERVVDVSPDVKVAIHEEDDLFGQLKFQKKLTFKILRNSFLFPSSDKVFIAESDEETTELLKEIQLAPGQAMPIPYHSLEDLPSDATTSRVFFYGIGSVLLADSTEYSELGPFVADMNISDLEVRDGYRRYGARLHFAADQTLTAVFDYAHEKLIKPGEPGWEEAKHLARQTAILVITGREHLLWTHLLCANAVERSCTECLPPSHPIRRLLGPFLFRTNYINNSATEALLPNLSLFHRGSALTYESVGKLMEAAYADSNIFEPFGDRKIGEDLQKLVDQGKLPYFSDGFAYFEIVRTFVSEWLAASGSSAKDEYAKKFYADVKASTKGQKYELPDYESKDAMVNLLAQTIFNVTAYHELVGTVVDYTKVPSGYGLRALENSTKTDLQSFLIGACITALTSIRTPKLMSEFPNYFGVGGAPAWEKQVWADFQAKIKEQSEVVHKANESRTHKFRSFNPEQFECAVSV